MNSREPKYKQDLRSIKDNPLAPVYVITGAESYLRKTAVDVILSKGGETEGAGLSRIKVFGDEVDADALSMQLVSYSLFAETKFIVIRDARKMKSDCWGVIETYLSSPSESTIVIIEGDKLDGRNAVIKKLRAHALWFDFPRLWENQLTGWIKSYARKQGYTITDEAAQYLRDLTEPKLWHYVQEFEKIRLFAGEKTRLELDDLAAITQSTRSFNIFEFTDALCEPDTGKTVVLLNQIFMFNENIPGILVMITRHLMILLKIKLSTGARANQKDILQKTGLTRFHYAKYKNQAEWFTIQEIQRLLEATLEADKNVKTGVHTDRMVLTLLVHQFASVVNRDAARRGGNQEAGTGR